MNSKAKKIGTTLLCAVALAACRAGTQPDQIGVHVTGYDIFPTDSKVQDCVAPSTNKYIGFGDKAYLYPAGQRSFIFDNDQNKKPETGEVQVVSKDNTTLGLSGVVTFSLNQDCETLKAFHQQIGSKVWGDHAAWISDGGDVDYKGFVAMLDVEIGNPLKNALTDDASQDNVLDLYSNAATRQRLEADLKVTLQQRIKDLTGGDYFRIEGVLLNKPSAPQSLVDALTAQQTAIQQNAAQKAQNDTAITAYQQVKECKALGISEASCIELYGINTGKITVLPQVPTGTNLVIPAPVAPGK